MANNPALRTYTPGGNRNFLDVTADTVLSTSAATVVTLVIQGTGTATGAIYDTATAGGASASTLVYTIPESSTTPIPVNFRCTHGVYVVPPTGAAIAVSLV